GDGLLVRLMPTAPVSLDRFIALCEAAREHGNGTLEVTARGSLQVRGLTPQSAPPFAVVVAALAIAANDGVQVIADPLPDDAGALAATVRDAIAAAELALAAKVSVVIDSGGRLHLAALTADVRLRATGTRLHVSLGGGAVVGAPPGAVGPGKAAGGGRGPAPCGYWAPRPACPCRRRSPRPRTRTLPLCRHHSCLPRRQAAATTAGQADRATSLARWLRCARPRAGIRPRPCRRALRARSHRREPRRAVGAPGACPCAAAAWSRRASCGCAELRRAGARLRAARGRST